MLTNGRELAKRIEAQIATEIQNRRIKPRLAVVLVGNDPASAVYVRKKQEAAARVGINLSLYEFPSSTDPKGLREFIVELGKDSRVHGIIIQMPLPRGWNPADFFNLIPPEKDVDGIRSTNLSGLLFGEARFTPATAGAVLEVLKSQRVKIAGSRAVVIGRGQVAGLPIALALLANDATVTIAHSKTKNLAKLTKQADILVSAVGKPAMVKPAMVKRGAVAIDVGISRVNGKLLGDVNLLVEKKVRFLTPVPGGIGPLTVAKLLENVFLASQFK